MKLLYILILLILITSSVKSNVSREDGSFVIDINLDDSLQNPAFSPDGSSIVFTRFRNGYNKGPADLYIYNLNSNELHMLVSDGSDNVNLPGNTWRNNKIIFSSSREPHDEIYIIEANGSPGDEIKITNRDNLVGYEPSFSNNNEWIVFESHKLDQEDNGVIMKYKIDKSSNYIELTDKNDDSREPNYSPIEDIIVYQKFQNNKWDLWLINGDGTNDHKLTSGDGSKTDASFSDDGQWIIYSTDIPNSDYANLFRILINGTIIEKLTSFPGYDGAPSYFGSNIIFESYKGDPDDSDGTTIWMRNITNTPTNTIPTETEDTVYPTILFIPTIFFLYMIKKLKFRC